MGSMFGKLPNQNWLSSESRDLAIRIVAISKILIVLVWRITDDLPPNFPTGKNSHCMVGNTPCPKCSSILSNDYVLQNAR